MKTFDAHILLIIAKFCAKIKIHKLCQLYFLSPFRFLILVFSMYVLQ